MREDIDSLPDPFDRALEGALIAIDRATLSLHLSLYGNSLEECINYAYQARDSFEAALATLKEVEAAFRATDAWHLWFLEAQEGLQSTINRLGLLDAAESFTTF